jgi:hypothetical protein
MQFHQLVSMLSIGALSSVGESFHWIIVGRTAARPIVGSIVSIFTGSADGLPQSTQCAKVP